jgi:superfamily I DNA/RNA helicase
LTRTAAYRAARIIELPFQQFGTVHAFAYRALGQPVLAEAKLDEWNKAYPNLQLAGHGQPHIPDDGYLMPEETTLADNLKLAYTRLLTIGIPRTAIEWQRASMRGFAERWEDWKAQNHYVDFVDLLVQATNEIDMAPGEPAVILGDEWQDVGALEHKLIMKWAEKAEHLVLAGDFAQALFRFRGTDPLLLQRLWEEHDPDRKPLDHSYRLPQAVYDYAWTWQQRFQFTRRVAYSPRKDTQDRIVEGYVQRAPAFATVTPRTLEQTLLPYLDAGKEVLILSTCGYMLDPIIRVMREMGLPFANTLRPNNGKWNPLPQKRGRGYTIVDRVLAFSRPRADLWGDAAHFWTSGEIKAWASALPVTGIFSRGGSAAIQGLSDDASDGEIAGMCRVWFTEEALRAIVPTPDLTWYLCHVKGSDSLRAYVAQVIGRYGVIKLQEKPLIQIGTCHSYKGGEADVVWISPDLSLEASTAAHRDPQTAEEMRRVFYTGVTRSRERLLLADASTRNCVRW